MPGSTQSTHGTSRRKRLDPDTPARSARPTGTRRYDAVGHRAEELWDRPQSCMEVTEIVNSYVALHAFKYTNK